MDLAKARYLIRRHDRRFHAAPRQACGNRGNRVARDRDGADLIRRHGKTVASAAGRRVGGDGHSPEHGAGRFRPDRPVRVFADRLRDGLHVLQHGHDGLYPQHDRRGNPEPGSRGSFILNDLLYFIYASGHK